MSEFIEKSKHAQMTAEVEAHFNGNGSRTALGAASGKGFNRFGDAQYNSVSDPFNTDGGLGYTPPGQAGHTVGGLPAGVKPKNTA